MIIITQNKINCYKIKTNALIIQWGLTSNILGSSYQDVNLIGYSNANYVILTSQKSTYASGTMANLIYNGATPVSSTVARITGRRPSSSADDAQVFWCTIGY